jgi:hypothetical protein
MACRHVKASDSVTANNSGEPGVSRIRLYPMTPTLRARLAELVDDRGIKGYRALSHRTGGEVSYETIRRILTGQVSQVRHGTLLALADALGTPLEVLIGDSLGEHHDLPWRPPAEFDRLPASMRPGIERALLALFRETRILPPGRPAEPE